MFKKIALAAAVAASASFATYNFFPVGAAHSGQVEAGIQYNWWEAGPADMSSMNIVAAGEFVVIDKLALSLQGLGYQLWSENTECDDDDVPGCDTDGLKAMTVGARYWFMPMLGAALDVNIPLNSEDAVGGKYDPFGLYAAIQFSTEFMPGLALGSEAGISYKFEDENTTEGLGLKIQAELDYTIASIGLTPWIGAAFNIRLSDIEVEEGPVTYKRGSGDNSIDLWIGASYSITQMFYVKANFLMTFADETETMGPDSMMGFNVKFGVNF
ncbi:MAG: hypothetical protein MJY82_05960 [Fibrobacter sp.]|nr:hypothetical protein [Fibrobacter sp.]